MTNPSTRRTSIPDRQLRRKMLTVYGRNAVREALQDRTLGCRTLHLASSNRGGGPIDELLGLAERRGLDVQYHSREELARISRNGRQDQGVALDVLCPAIRELRDFLDDGPATNLRLLAMDRVTNPQNVGMVIRSATAAGIHGILYADRGNPALGPLVIKASAGTVFRAPLLRCESLLDALQALQAAGFSLYRLDARGTQSVFNLGTPAGASIFVLGGESDGLSREVLALPGTDLMIPMANGVESLNVAVSAALLAYALRPVE